MRMTIAMFTDGPAFEADALESGALGGAETCFVQMAQALARRGHEVLALNNCREPAERLGVKWLPVRQSLPLLASQSFDVLVVSRFFGFFSLPIKSRLKVLWNHDTLDDARALRAIHDEIDLFLVLSEFHRDNYLTRLPQLEDRTVVTRNGLDLDLIDAAAASAAKAPGKLIYASRPERGLSVLLERIWPRLRTARPDLRLHVCGYVVDQGLLDPSLKDLHARLSALVESDPFVVDLGALSKKDYYRHLAESEMMVYPSTFPEVSCLAVLEAQAAGTAVLTTDSWALSESVAVPEFKVPGRPLTTNYQDRYVDRALRFLSDPAQTAALAAKAREIVRSRHDWDLIAGQWLRLFGLAIRSKERRPCLLEIQQKAADALLA
jgi:glycosyltransferase involved in cell wall biosynthesis